MTDKKTEPKNATESIGLQQGAYDTVVLIPQTNKRDDAFNKVIASLKAGKYFIMREGYSRNSVYALIKKIKEKTDIDAIFGQCESKKGDKTVKQYVLYVKKSKA